MSHSECEVRIRNLTIESLENTTNGKCLELQNCSNFEISNCGLVARSDSSDMAPYPGR